MPTASHGSAISSTPRRAAHLVELGDERPVPAEHRRQVEPEAVDAEVGEPVERPQHEVLGDE